MLMTQSFVRLLQASQNNELAFSLEEPTCQMIPLVLARTLTRTLQSQAVNGSWGQDSSEITAYAILTLVSLAELAWIDTLRPELGHAIEKGKHFLNDHRLSNKPDALWVEKVTYSSQILSQTYCLAALKASSSPQSRMMEKIAGGITLAVDEGQRFFSRIPLFYQIPERKLKLSLLESLMFFPLLERKKADIFLWTGIGNERYLEYIPFTWTGSDNLTTTQMNNSVLWEMMVISMLNYQVDEYMERVVGKLSVENLNSTKRMIHNLCSDASTTKSRDSPSRHLHPGDEKNHFDPSADPTNTDESLINIEKTLSRFTTYISTHPSVLSTPIPTQHHLKDSIATFLLAHITQIEDNANFSLQKHHAKEPTTFCSPRGSYHE